MPGRKRRQHYPRRRRNGNENAGSGPSEQELNAAAERLLRSYDGASLARLLDEQEAVVQSADQEAQDRPGPEALSRYRTAVRVLAELERAVVLSRARSGDR